LYALKINETKANANLNVVVETQIEASKQQHISRTRIECKRTKHPINKIPRICHPFVVVESFPFLFLQMSLKCV